MEGVDKDRLAVVFQDLEAFELRPRKVDGRYLRFLESKAQSGRQRYLSLWPLALGSFDDEEDSRGIGELHMHMQLEERLRLQSRPDWACWRVSWWQANKDRMKRREPKGNEGNEGREVSGGAGEGRGRVRQRKERLVKFAVLLGSLQNCGPQNSHPREFLGSESMNLAKRSTHTRRPGRDMPANDLGPAVSRLPNRWSPRTENPSLDQEWRVF